MEELQFRTAALGGFQKQDVMNYIELVGKEHAAKLETLEKERDEARERLAEQEARADEAEKDRESMTRQLMDLTNRLSAGDKALDEAKAEASREKAAREELEQKLSEFQARLEKAEHAAAAYESIKDRTAGIELEAHHRAMEVEAAAKEQVKATKLELEQWIYKVRAGYDRLRTDVDATVSHAAGELDRVRKSLEGLTGEFSERDSDLEQLLKTYQESLGPQAPSPLPLDEE